MGIVPFVFYYWQDWKFDSTYACCLSVHRCFFDVFDFTPKLECYFAQLGVLCWMEFQFYWSLVVYQVNELSMRCANFKDHCFILSHVWMFEEFVLEQMQLAQLCSALILLLRDFLSSWKHFTSFNQGRYFNCFTLTLSYSEVFRFVGNSQANRKVMKVSFQSSVWIYLQCCWTD